MPQVSRRLISPKIEKRIYEVFVVAIGKVNRKDEILTFISDLLTPTERVMIAKRLSVALLLLRGNCNHREIGKTLKVSTSTVARVNLILRTQGTGFRKVLGKMLREQALKIMLNELYEGLTPVPPKGVNWGEWKKTRRERKQRLPSF